MSDELKPKPVKEEVVFRATLPFRLKDRPESRRVQLFRLFNIFGFDPKVIGIEKIAGRNNRLRLIAVVPKDQLEYEKKMREAAQKKTKAQEKKNVA